MENLKVSCEAERLAVKSICASDILQNVLSTAKELEVLNKKLTRYVSQIQLLLTWRQGSAALKMVGSTAKTVASLMVMAAPLHPKLGIALGVGHKFWKLGIGLKILNTVANIVRDLWQDGCRKCLLDFSHTAALLTRSLGVFGEVISDLQNTTQKLSSESSLETPQQLFNLIKHFIPSAQHVYVAHISSIVFGGQRYSPLFDFIALISDPANQSPSMQLLRELESLNFTEFVEETDCKSLVALSTLLHISREIMDFLDGFHQFSDKDCTFLKECLVKFTQESLSILKVVSFLVSITRQRSLEAPNGENSTILQTPPALQSSKKSDGMEFMADEKCEAITPDQVESKSNNIEVGASCNVTADSCQAFSAVTDNGNIRNEDVSEIGQDLKKCVLKKTFSSLSGLVKKSSSAILSISSKIEKPKVSGQDTDDDFSQFQKDKDKTRI